MTDASELTYIVPGVSCGHCVAAVTEEVEQVPGVRSVEVALETKQVTVSGAGVDDGAVRAAIEEAGYRIVNGDGGVVRDFELVREVGGEHGH